MVILQRDIGTAALALVLCLVLAGLPAWAQERETLGVTAGLIGSGVAEADVENGRGRVGAASAGAWVSCPVADLGYVLTKYSWDDVSGLPFGNGSDDPWETLHSLSLDMHHNGMWDEHWGYFLGGSLGMEWEDEMDGAGSLDLRGGGVYAVDRDLSFSFGLLARLHATGLRIFPALGMNWKKADQEGFSATVGLPETWLRWRFDPTWAARLGAGLVTGTYRLKDGSPVADAGYVSVFGVAAGLMLDWSPRPGLTLSVGPRYHFARSLTVYDDDGDKRDDYGLDPALGGSASLRWSF